MANSSLFVNESSGDLHLRSCAYQVFNQGDFYSDAALDFDGQARTVNGKVDIGADEQIALPPISNTPRNQPIVLMHIYELLLD